MDFQVTPSSSQQGKGQTPRYSLPMATPPQQQGTSQLNTFHDLLTTPNPSSSGSSQNSEHAPSVISISSSSPYQFGSGLGAESGAGGGSVCTSEQYSQGNTLMIAPQNPRRRGSSNKYVVVQQIEGPSDSGVGGCGGKSDAPKRGGGRKTSHTVTVTPALTENTENGDLDDEVQIVEDKGVNSGRRGGARKKQSGDPDVEVESEERHVRTRENERRRRAMHRESADKLRGLVPGLNDGKSRRVGEGIVMEKSAEYIEKLLGQLKTHRATAKASRIVVMSNVGQNMVKQLRCIQLVINWREQSRNGINLLVPQQTIESVHPVLRLPNNPPELREGLKKVYQDLKVATELVRVPGAGPNPCLVGGGIQLQVRSPGEQGISSGFIPLPGSSQGYYQRPVVMYPQACPRFVATQRNESQQQLVISNVAAQTVDAQAVQPRQTPLGQGLQLPKVLPIGYHGGIPQRLIQPQCLVGSQDQLRIGSSPVPGTFAIQQRGSIAGQKVVRTNSVPSAQGHLCLVNYTRGGQLSQSGMSENHLAHQQIQHRVVGKVGKDGLSEPMSLFSLKRKAEEPGIQELPSQSVQKRAKRILGDVNEDDVSELQNVGHEVVNLLAVKNEPLDVDEGDESDDFLGVAVPGILAIKAEVDDEGEGSEETVLASIKQEPDEEEEEDRRANLKAIKHEVEDDDEESYEEEPKGEDLNVHPRPALLPLPNLGHRPSSYISGWSIPEFGDLVPSSDEDDEDEQFEAQRATNPLVENRQGSKVRMGFNRAMENAKAMASGCGASARRARAASDEELVARWEQHDQLFRDDELFKNDYIWNGYSDDPNIGKGIKKDAGKLWEEVVKEREEKEAQENHEPTKKRGGRRRGSGGRLGGRGNQY